MKTKENKGETEMFKLIFAPVDLGPSPSDRRRARLRRRRWHQTAATAAPPSPGVPDWSSSEN